MVWQAFDNCKDLHQMKGKLNQTGYYNATRSHMERGLWLKDLYLRKIMIQSLSVNSARSSADVLADVIKGLVWDELDRKSELNNS